MPGAFLLIAGLLASESTAVAQPTVIDFETLPPRSTVTTQLASQGVRFVPSAFIDDDSNARSGTRVLRSANPTNEFNTGPLTIEFLSGQLSVRFFAADRFSGSSGSLRAFDGAGNLVAQDGPKSISQGAYTTEFRVVVSSPVIRRAVLQYQGTAFESIDDLEFAGTAAPPPPTSSPEVTIAFPDNFITTQSAITLQGTVTGEQLTSSARLAIAIPRPSGTTAPGAISSALALQGTGDTRSFSVPVQLQLGPQTITVEAENVGGSKGSATVRISFLPTALADAIRAESRDDLGPFLFSGTDTDQRCAYAVFEHAAIGLAGGIAVARGPILVKWLSVRDDNGFPTLGCPVSPERTVVGDDASLQDFQKARIYADSRGSFFVPTVFAQAIDAHGGEALVGIPLSDPGSSAGAMRTWLFQRFRRPGRTDHDATLEIRGLPPRLYVERRANDPRAAIPSPSSPTVVDDYPCSANLGPCDIVFGTDTPIDNLGRFCNNSHFDWAGVAEALLDRSKVDLIDTDPPEWAAIEGNHVLTALRGIVIDAHRSIEDNPFAHEFSIDCPTSLASLGPLVANWRKRGFDTDPPLCPADLDVAVSPLRGFRRLVGVGEGSDPSHNDDVVMEYELGHARAFTAFGGDPHVGDLVTAAGRWIVDCGHAYKTEIHPPSVLAYARTFDGNGTRSTIAHVWINGFYPGDPFEVLIHAPPRPSPDATLSLTKVLGSSNVGLTVADDIVAGQFVRLRISAATRLVEVTEVGEMKHEAGRAFRGRYTVIWTP